MKKKISFFAQVKKKSFKLMGLNDVDWCETYCQDISCEECEKWCDFNQLGWGF